EAGLVLLKEWSSFMMLRRFSSRPLVEKEWVRVAPLSSCTLAKAWRPSTVTVQLVTMMSWPSKLVLVMPMAVSLVKVIALAVGTPMIRSIERVNHRNGLNDLFIAMTAEGTTRSDTRRRR